MTRPLDPASCRAGFPALSRRIDGRPVAYLDGPAGSQVPRPVIDAMEKYLIETNANCEGLFATSVASDSVLHEAHRAVADFLGADDPGLVIFGPNMTTLTLALARAVSREWHPGDEVLVTRLEHDANFTPWVQAARDAGATVRYVDIDRSDCTLDLEDLSAKLSERTRLLAVGAASNAVGTITPMKQIVEMAHAVGADVFVDAVHYAPHRLIDVQDWNCDFVVCSAYKFFGPHVGILAASVVEGGGQARNRPAPARRSRPPRQQNGVLVLQVGGRDDEVIARGVLVNELRLDELEGKTVGVEIVVVGRVISYLPGSPNPPW